MTPCRRSLRITKSLLPLASVNGIATNAPLANHQMLLLPTDAVKPRDVPRTPPPQTPAEKTDAAYQTLKDAQARLAADESSPAGKADVRDDAAAVAQARGDFQAAVQDETNAKVIRANDGVPPQYRTAESTLIQRYGAEVLKRYEGQPAAQSEIRAAIADDVSTQQAKSLVPDYSGDWTAADKLKGIVLDGQPQAVIDKVLADPRVQAWIKQAAADIEKPYANTSEQDVYYAKDAATEASGKLLSTVQNLPPELARGGSGEHANRPEDHQP